MIKVLVPPEDHMSSWSYPSTIDSSLDEVSIHGLNLESEIENFQLSSIFLSTAEIWNDKLQSYPGGIQSNEDPSSFKEVEDYIDWMDYEENSASRECSVNGTSSLITTESSTHFCSAQESNLVFPDDDMELEDQLSIHHLFKALGEAKQNQHDDLVNVILRRIKEKACPRGIAFARLAYYLIQSSESNLDCCYYLTLEANKNYDAALSAFYQIFPYGRFAHFVANSSILEALPEDVKMIHIVDFDIGQGVQWPPLIEAIVTKHPKVAIRLISLKWDDSDYVSESFQNTKKWLCYHADAYSSNIKLKIEELTIQELASEMRRIGNCRGRGDWVAFNCMINLPHMKKHSSRRSVLEFSKIAQEYLGKFSNRQGILMFGNGNCLENNADRYLFSSLFEAELRRMTALLESMELQMPMHLREARVAMECLFVAPYLTSLVCVSQSERDLGGGFVPKLELGARKLSRDAIEEAKELLLVSEGDALYCIRTEGEDDNQLVLSFKGTPLVRVSSLG